MMKSKHVRLLLLESDKNLTVLLRDIFDSSYPTQNLQLSMFFVRRLIPFLLHHLWRQNVLYYSTYSVVLNKPFEFFLTHYQTLI